MALMTLVHFAILSFRGGALYNYYHHYADKAAMFDFVEKLGLTAPALAADAPKPGGLLEWLGYIVHGTRDNLSASNVADVFNSLVNMIGTLTTIIVILLSASLAHRFGKKAVAVVGFALSTLCAFAFYFLKPSDVYGMVGLTILGSLVYAPTIPLVWAIFADVADYSEWKTGRRFTGMVFATIGFALKAGLALGSASFLWLMAGLFHYDTKLPAAPDAVGRLSRAIRHRGRADVRALHRPAADLQTRQARHPPDVRRTRRTQTKGRRMTSIAPLLTALLLAVGVHAQELTLKTTFKDHFFVGAALNPAQFYESNRSEAALVKAQFNSITAENVMKWEHIHPRPGEYDFSQVDRFVNFGVSNDMFIIGHTLVWHAQTPDWVFQDANGKPVTREILLQRMRDHIFTVVGRYQGKVKGWDVVNEAIEDDGSLRKSPWRKIIGDDFIEQAFEFAHEADRDAELYYNDYGLENSEKRAGALALVKKLQAKGIRISGVGLQGHYQLASDSPSAEEFSRTISDFAQLGVKVMITELDVDVLPSVWAALSADVSLRKKGGKEFNPYTNGLPVNS